jgi:hypothetical protein
MTHRSEAPTYQLLSVGETQRDEERAKRLALFSSTLRESPEVMSMLMHKAGTASEMLRKAQHPDVEAYGQRLDALEEFPYDNRAIYTIGALLLHNDGDHVAFDTETQHAMARAMKDDTADYPHMDARIDARELLVWTVFTDESVRYQAFGPHSGDTVEAA